MSKGNYDDLVYSPVSPLEGAVKQTRLGQGMLWLEIYPWRRKRFRVRDHCLRVWCMYVCIYVCMYVRKYVCMYFVFISREMLSTYLGIHLNE